MFRDKDFTFANMRLLKGPGHLRDFYFHAVKKCFNWPGCDILIVEVK